MLIHGDFNTIVTRLTQPRWHGLVNLNIDYFSPVLSLSLLNIQSLYFSILFTRKITLAAILLLRLHQQMISLGVIVYYSMVGVVVAMVISTMREKSCIDLHNARKFEKSSKIQSFTQLAITMIKLRKYQLRKLSCLYDAIIQKVISYQIEPSWSLNFHRFHCTTWYRKA